VISYEEYYPYGASAYRASSSSADLSLKRYRFTGKERDSETGLDYFGVRYYASWLGRWTSGDPGGFVDGLNLYRYTRNDPVNNVDAWGYSTEDPPPAEITGASPSYNWVPVHNDDLVAPQVNNKLYSVKFSSGGRSTVEVNSVDSNTDPDYVPPPEITGNEKKGDLSPDGLYFYSGDGDQKPGKWILVPTQEQLNETKQQIQEGIDEARKEGSIYAANNLQRWLDGNGGTKTEDAEWLQKVPSVIEAVELNEKRFFDQLNSQSKSINAIAANLKNGESVDFSDYWVAQITTDYVTFDKNEKDFFYAWGSATLTSTGNFTITRNDNVVEVSGSVTHEFFDIYNWEPGMSVPIGDQYVSDEQFIPLEVYDKAKPFKGISTWTNPVNKIIKPKWFLHKK
jgi:RHS repeat-associated protein